MKNVIWIVLIATVLVTACTTIFNANNPTSQDINSPGSLVHDVNNPPITSADEPSPPGTIHNLPKGCFVMKNINSRQYDCFGCVGDTCKDPDLKAWDYTDQDQARSNGYNCIKTPNGCELIIAPVKPSY